MDELSRDAPVIPTALRGYIFPAPNRYEEASLDNYIMLLAWAPWFNFGALEHEDVVPQYVVYVWLLVGVPLAATETWAWRRKLDCYDAYLYIGNGRTVEGVRDKFSESKNSGYYDMRT